MEKNVNRVCYTCGGTSFIKINSRTLKCEYCGNVIENNDSLSSEVITFLNQGDACRRKIDFENAEEYYSLAKEKDATCAEAYFGLLMCEYGVTHVKDPVTEIMKPTLNRLSETPIKESLFYKKLFECLFDNESKKIYQKKCDELEEIRKKSLEISKSKKGYDIFISFKKTPFETGNGDYTKDYVEAKELYNKLNNDYRFKGKVFFSEETLKDYAGEDYEPVIYNALKTSKLMFVFSSKKEYGNAGWVKNEWTRFLKMKVQDSSKVLIPIILNTIDDLPDPLQKIQGIFCDKNYNENINKKINEVFKNNVNAFGKGEKIVELNITKHIDIDKIEEGNGFSGEGVDISTSEKALYEQIFASLAIGKFKEAEGICNLLLEKNPDNPYPLWNKIYCECKAKTKKDLIKLFFVKCPSLDELKKIFSTVSKDAGSDYLYTIVDAISHALRNNLPLKVDYFDSIVSFCYGYLINDETTLKSIYESIIAYIKNYLLNKHFVKSVYSNAELIKLGNLILKNPYVSSNEEMFSAVSYSIGLRFSLYANKKNQTFFSLAKTFFEKAINANPTLYEAVFYYHLMNKETSMSLMYENINEKNYEEYTNILKDLLERKYKIKSVNGYYLKPSNKYPLEDTIYYYFHEVVNKLLLHNKLNVAKLFFQKYITFSYFKTNNLSLYVKELHYFAGMLLTYNDFDGAKEYYNEIVTCDKNDYTAFIGLLNCEFKCNNCLDLVLSKNKIGESKNYFSALTIAGSINQSSLIQKFYIMSSSLKGKARKVLLETNKICKKYHLVIPFEKLISNNFNPNVIKYNSLQYETFYNEYANRVNNDSIAKNVWKNNFSIKNSFYKDFLIMFFICSILICFTKPFYLRNHTLFIQIWIPLLTLLVLRIFVRLTVFRTTNMKKITSLRFFNLIAYYGVFIGSYLLSGITYPYIKEYIEVNSFLSIVGYYIFTILIVLIMVLLIAKIYSLFFMRKEDMNISNKKNYDDCFTDTSNDNKSIIFNINKGYNKKII